MKDIYNYIKFELVEQKEKTQIYCIRNIKTQLILGFIKWHGAWRQYCFEPMVSPFTYTIFSKGCLKDIIDFIEQLMKERKNNGTR